MEEVKAEPKEQLAQTLKMLQSCHPLDYALLATLDPEIRQMAEELHKKSRWLLMVVTAYENVEEQPELLQALASWE